jgi:hypothetical protein
MRMAMIGKAGVQRQPHTGRYSCPIYLERFPESGLINSHVRSVVLSRFGQCSQFDDHEKIPSVNVIEILLAVNDSTANVRVNFGWRQRYFFEKCVDPKHPVAGQRRDPGFVPEM